MRSMAGDEIARDDLSAFVRYLEAEGYALEFDAAQAFADAGFEVSQNVGYAVADEAPAREADVAAYVSELSGSGVVSVSIAVECKSFWNANLGVFMASDSAPEPLATTFDIGDYLRGVNVKPEPVSLTIPVDAHAFKAVLKSSGKDPRRDLLWAAIQQVLSARDGLAKDRGDNEAVTKVAVLVTNATLSAVRRTLAGLVAHPIESAVVRVAGALGRTQDVVVIVHRSGLVRFAKGAADACRRYVNDLATKLQPHFDAQSEARRRPLPITAATTTEPPRESDANDNAQA